MGVFEWLGGGSGGGSGAEAFDGDLAADALVGALVVVDVAELVELGLQFVEVGGEGLFAEPFLQRLLEAFDLAGGLGVVGAAGDRGHAGVAETSFEDHFEAVELARKAQSVV